MKITIHIDSSDDRRAVEFLVAALDAAKNSLKVQISPAAEAENLRSWADILQDDGEEEEARALRDAADIIDDGIRL